MDPDELPDEYVCPQCGETAEADASITEIDGDADVPSMTIQFSVICPNCGEIASLFSQDE